MLLIAGIVVATIVVIFAVMKNRKSTQWTREDNVSYVSGYVTPNGDGADANVRYIGLFASRDECEAKCATLPWVKAYTWFDPTVENIEYGGQCYGMSSIPRKTAMPGAQSGMRVIKPAAPKPTDTTVKTDNFTPNLIPIPAHFVAKPPTFSNTIQRRLGMESAGASSSESFGTKSRVGTFDGVYGDMTGETFRSQNDVAAGTMFSGYQYSSILPN
jgi:hypothetical protein